MSRRRRVGLVLGVVLLLAVVALGVQTWRVVSAIVDAESVAIVPLPTREGEVAFGNTKAMTPAATTTPAAVGTEAAVSGAGESATATAFSTSIPTTTLAATSQPTPAPDNLSRLDVLRKVVQAGMENGDPGRSTVWGGKTELYILVLGVDRRADGGDQNADVVIIAHLDLIQKRLAAVSIPRDLLVDIPEIGPDKINSSYNYGVKERPGDAAAGVAKVRDTVEHVFGVPIDAYALLDFDGFRAVVDAAGGVEIDVPVAIHDEDYPTEDYGTKVVDFKQGRQQMNGERALEYVRTRHSDSDDARRDRQRQVLLALFEKGKGLQSATRADNIILALGGSVQTSFPLEQQLTLARLAFAMDETAIVITPLGQPVLQEGQTPDGRWAYVGDTDAIVEFVRNALVIAPAVTGAE
ncbi:MAG: polyisoprenyl-teichoic acid--peptidoglycan teichoic acid transferase [Thermomicrobiales bacterium]|nr:polyisoprenyl-teichoic acid--peptidoglycan teichoic acid transferase [Thermomicrobiales bacterium]